MAGEAYVKRYAGGFVDLPSLTTPEDSQFLNAVEAALLRLLGADPVDQGVQVWDAVLARMKSIKLTNAQVDAAAAIARSKLDFGGGLVNADVAVAAAIAYSKLQLAGSIVNADISAAAAILGSKIQVSAGTAPPGSPGDGDFWLYRDSNTTPTAVWLFKYNSLSTSSFKWEFIGGAPAFANVETSETTTSATPVDLATVGPSWTLPRAGDYGFRWGVSASDGTLGAATTVYLMKGAVEQMRSVVVHAAGYELLSSGLWRITGAAASDVVKLQYSASAGTGTFLRRHLEVVPVRVS